VASTYFVTGATGLVGSNLCRTLVDAGHRVRGLVRSEADASRLAAIGVEPCIGDVTDAASIVAATNGADHVVHTAAAIGGTKSAATEADFVAINDRGTVNVLDAAATAETGRVVLVGSTAVLDRSVTMTETSPLGPISLTESPYRRTKRVAYYEAMVRAARGQDIVQVLPGAIFGPAPLADRALAATSWNSSLTASIRGELDDFPGVTMAWSYVADIVDVIVRAVERGRIGERYLALGPPGSVLTLAGFCNLANARAGVEHRMADLDLASAPERFGPMAALAGRPEADPAFDLSGTTARLGYQPTALEESLDTTIAWLRALGRI
jgi:nucleoside-diphosphate-sugar epimerase